MTLAPAQTVPAFRSFDVSVRSVTRLSPHFQRVTFTGEDLDLFGDTCLDQRIKIILPIPGADSADPFEHLPRGEDWYARWRQLPEQHKNPLRTYTVRAVRQHLNEVDVDFVCHGDTGVASAWVNRALPGDRCVLIGPDVRGESDTLGVEWKPGQATEVLLAGDETALPAISSILASLPPHACGQAFIEVPTYDDALPVTPPEGVSVAWLPRDGASPETHHGYELVSAVTSHLDVGPQKTGSDGGFDGLDAIDNNAERLWETPAVEPGHGAFAWLAGEASAITTLRRHLVKERGWDRQRVAFMGYWRLGRSEL